MTEPTLVFMMTAIAGWFTTSFNGLDAVQIWGISILDLLCILAVIEITQWFVFRFIDSPKSDN